MCTTTRRRRGPRWVRWSAPWTTPSPDTTRRWTFTPATRKCRVSYPLGQCVGSVKIIFGSESDLSGNSVSVSSSGSNVVDPDPKGSESFCRIRIRIIGLDPEPKESLYKFWVVKLAFSCELDPDMNYSDPVPPRSRIRMNMRPRIRIRTKSCRIHNTVWI